LSDQFAAGSAVTQASCWSPDISNVFISVLILQLKELNIGCRVSGMFGGCLLHPDDIILLSPGVAGLQEMLDTCYEVACSVSLQFNVHKCHRLVVGKMCKFSVSRVSLAIRKVNGVTKSNIWAYTLNVMSTH